MKKLITIVLLISSLSVYSQECKYSTNETDTFTGAKRLVVKSEKIFKDRDVEIKVSSGVIGDKSVIYWMFIVNTSSAYSTYGYLSDDLSIMIKCDTNIVELPIGDNSTGKSNYEYNYTMYSTFTILNKSDIDALSTNNISAIRVYWTKGYEDYAIELSDVLVKQINCIK